MSWRDSRWLPRLPDAMLGMLVVLAPLGTRYVLRWGELNGASVEYGTLSVWATQLLALAYVVAVGCLCRDKPAVAPAQAGAGMAGRERGWILAFFFVVAGVAAARAANVLDAFQHLLWLVLGAGVLWAAARHRPSSRLVLGAFVVGGLAQSLLAVWQFAHQEVVGSTLLGVAAHVPAELGASVVGIGEGRVLRAYGTFSHPNMLGGYLAFALVAAVAWWRQRPAWWLLPALTLLACGLFFSFSRGALLATAFGVVAMIAAFGFRQGMRSALRALVAPLGMVAVVVVVLAVGNQSLVHTRVSAQSALEQRSVRERGDFAREAWQLFARHPLVGVGPGQMPATVRAELDPAREGWAYQPAHLVPLLVLAEVGVLGLGALLALSAVGIRAMWRRVRAGEADPAVLVGFGAVLCVVGAVDHYLWSFWPGMALVVLVVVSASGRTSAPA